MRNRSIGSAVMAAVLALVAVSAQSPNRPPTTSKPFTVVEATIADRRKALDEKRITSHEIVAQYLMRIATYEDKLHAALYVNPRALQEADELDRERAAGKIRGPLHGIPIALKDNVLTTTMPTTGGALVFDGYVPRYDATITTN